MFFAEDLSDGLYVPNRIAQPRNAVSVFINPNEDGDAANDSRNKCSFLARCRQVLVMGEVSKGL